MKHLHSRWGLYWVSSDGNEDCFMVARNFRSAARVEAEYCGFESNDLRVFRVQEISPAMLRRWEVRRKKESGSFRLPGYADQWLLRKLGARFREREHLSETLIDDVVFTNGSRGQVPPRIIGKRLISDFLSIKRFQRYGHEDRYTESQMTLFSILGICVARSQEIEHLIAHSFILAAMSPCDRKRNLTIGKAIAEWKRKTLGQMIRAIEEGYEIDPTFRASLRLFLDMRNRLIHGLTTSEQYDIHTSWGQDEMIAFLSLFELISRPLRAAFQASLYASIDIGNNKFLSDSLDRHVPLTKRQMKKISLFAAFFTPKQAGASSSAGGKAQVANNSIERTEEPHPIGLTAATA